MLTSLAVWKPSFALSWNPSPLMALHLNELVVPPRTDRFFSLLRRSLVFLSAFVS